jgi:hypothetical protein
MGSPPVEQEAPPGKRTLSEAWPAMHPPAQAAAAVTSARSGEDPAAGQRPLGPRPSLQRLFGGPAARGGDTGLEAEADRAGPQAAAGERVADLGGTGGAAASSTTQGKGVQRKAVHTQYGTFRDQRFEEKTSIEDGLVQGVDIELTFTPGDQANATKIGLVQSARNLVHGKPIAIDPTKRNQMVPSGPAEGYGIDKQSNTRNPLYATMSDPLQDADKLESYATQEEMGEHGYRYQDDQGWHVQDAKLLDKPTCPTESNASLSFETTALAVDGEQKGTYYGSVSWGIQADSEGKLSKVDLQKVSDAKPSQNFMAAAKQWNASRSQGTLVIARAGAEVQADGEGEDFTLDKGVTVHQLDSGVQDGQAYLRVMVNAHHPTHPKRTGLILQADVEDRGDGPDTVKLPIVE